MYRLQGDVDLRRSTAAGYKVMSTLRIRDPQQLYYYISCYNVEAQLTLAEWARVWQGLLYNLYGCCQLST